MGKVDAFSINGLEMFFHSNDHTPHHFHVEKTGDWEIKVLFLACTIESGLVYKHLWGKTPAAKHLRLINEHVLAHQEALLDEWNAKVCQD